MREDQGKVPDDFPKLKCRSRLHDGKCYMPYYSAKEVWKWFRNSLSGVKDDETS